MCNSVTPYKCLLYMSYHQLEISMIKKQTIVSSLTTTSSTVSGLKILPDTQACYIVVIFILILSLIPQALYLLLLGKFLSIPSSLFHH